MALDVPAIELYLRDTAFNRGPTGAVIILQRALGIPDDGLRGPETRRAVKEAEKNPTNLLNKLDQERRDYELEVAGKRPDMEDGLEHRWQNVLALSRLYLDGGPSESNFFTKEEAIRRSEKRGDYYGSPLSRWDY